MVSGYIVGLSSELICLCPSDLNTSVLVQSSHQAISFFSSKDLTFRRLMSTIVDVPHR